MAGLLAVGAYFPYILAILRRQTKPTKSTWIIWTVLSSLTAAGMYQAGALNAQIAIIAFGDFFVVALAFRWGVPGWSRLDIFCLSGAAIGIIGWAVTHNPVVAVLIGLSVTVIGSVPTIVKTWHRPDQEDLTAYSLMVGSCVVQIAAIPAWTITDAAQPIVFLGVAGTILLLILTRPRPQAEA